MNYNGVISYDHVNLAKSCKKILQNLVDSPHIKNDQNLTELNYYNENYSACPQ